MAPPCAPPQVYPTCSSTVLTCFLCTDVDGTAYLTADLNKLCYDEDYLGPNPSLTSTMDHTP